MACAYLTRCHLFYTVSTLKRRMRNPLYHWTHLELSRVFGIDKLLSPATAREIFDECNAKLGTEEFRGQALIRRFNVVQLPRRSPLGRTFAFRYKLLGSTILELGRLLHLGNLP